MDPDRSLSSRREPRAHAVAHEYLGAVLERFPMAVSWVKHLAGWQRYYRRAKIRYKEVGGKVGGSPDSSTSESDGSGLKDYATFFEKIHKEFGDLTAKNEGQWIDKDLDWKDSALPSEDDHMEPTASPGTKQVKREMEDRSVSTYVQDLSQFAAVNTIPSTPVSGYRVPVGASVVELPYQPSHEQGTSSSATPQFYSTIHPPPATTSYEASLTYTQLNQPTTDVHSEEGTDGIPGAASTPTNFGYNSEEKLQMEEIGRCSFNTRSDVYPQFMGDATVDSGQAYHIFAGLTGFPFYPYETYSDQGNWQSGTGANDYSYHQLQPN